MTDQAVQTLDVTVKVHKEAYELGKGAAGVVLAVKQALADGWDPATDLPSIIVNSVKELLPAVDGLQNLSAESKANGVMFGKSLALPLTEAAESFL